MFQGAFGRVPPRRAGPEATRARELHMRQGPFSVPPFDQLFPQISGFQEVIGGFEEEVLGRHCGQEHGLEFSDEKIPFAVTLLNIQVESRPGADEDGS